MAVEMAEGYGWVVLALVANILVTNAWMPAKVLEARQKYKIFYPIMYATESESKDAKAFNCVQRGHQNTMEFLPAFLALLLLGSIQYPLVAAGFGALYTVGRIQYFRGFTLLQDIMVGQEFSGLALLASSFAPLLSVFTSFFQPMCNGPPQMR